MKHSFHAHHAPVGAGRSFLVGLNGAPGGFVRGAAPEGTQDVFVGYRYPGEPWTLLPFMRDARAQAAGAAWAVLPHGRYGRMFGSASDRWMAQALVFLLVSPFSADAAGPTPAGWLDLPAVYGLLDYDNSHMSVPVDLVFALAGGTWRPLAPDGGLVGWRAQDGDSAFAARGVVEKTAFEGPQVLGVGATGLLFRIPAGGKAVIPLVLGWGGDLDGTLARAAQQLDGARDQAQRCDAPLRASGLAEDARRRVALATREALAASEAGAAFDLSIGAMRARAGV